MGSPMKGFLKKRSADSWSVVVFLGKDPVTGKKKYKWHTVQGNKKKAEAELVRLLRELQTGSYVEPHRITIAEYLDKWLEDYAKLNVSPKTFERYASIVKKHLVPEFGSMQLVKLQPLHIQSAYSTWLKGGRQDGREGELSAQTVLHHHRVLSEALKQAVRWQLVARNVADAVEPPRPAHREMTALGEDESIFLLEAATGTRLHVPILLAITTGMRRGEILALRWQDVNLLTGIVTVRRSIQETKAGISYKETKSRRARVVSLPTMANEILTTHRSRRNEIKIALGTDYRTRISSAVERTAQSGPHRLSRPPTALCCAGENSGTSRFTVSGTRTPRNCSGPASVPRSSRNGSDMPRWGSRWTCTRVCFQGCKRKPPPRWTRRCAPRWRSTAARPAHPVWISSGFAGLARD